MHTGIGFSFQNPEHVRSDVDIYRDVLALADQAEGLGFESIWATEHHFTDYQISPDPLQFLTYMAGRTRQVQLGTMAVILPWHDPVRVAERVALLDILSGGRVILGVGRGLGKVEFEGFRLRMDESRERFVECAQLALRALEDGYLEYNGKYFQQSRRELRPTPIQSFKGRTYAAAVSPDSMRIMAELGVGILIIPQKPWETVINELGEYQRIFTEVNGTEAPTPIVAAFVYCDSDEERAREMAYTYMSGYYHSVLDHYQLAGDHFKSTKGYEYYDKMASVINRYGVDDTSKFFANLQVWGTPEQCYEKIHWLYTAIDCRTFVAIFDYAGLPFEEAERSMKLFAREVMPRLQARL